MGWKKHIENITNAANRRLRFLPRIFHKCPESVKEVGYFALVRPLLEYRTPVWSPHRVGLMQDLEMTRQRAARFVTGRYRRTESVTGSTPLVTTGYPENEAGQSQYGTAGEILARHVMLDWFPRFSSWNLENREVSTLNNWLRVARTHPFYWSFFPRIIRQWNGLPLDHLTLTKFFVDDG